MSKFLSLIKAMGFGTAADAAVHVGISTDTQPRLQIDAGGKHTWGAGSTTPGDTTLYRSAADTLKTDDAFIATGGLTVKTTEIDTASATSGQALVFNGTKFAPGVPTSGTLDGLTDVVISTSTTGQVLKYDGTNWVNATLVSGVSVSDAAPSSPTQGQLWFESDTGLTYIYYDSFWVEVGAGSSYDPVTNTIQAKGDLIVGTASQALSRQAVGTDSQRLIANSSTTTGVSWANDSTNTVIDTKGDLLVGATNDVVAKLPVGTNAQMLVADSTATNGISWQSPLTSGGHSNIYSNSLSTTSATIVSASRTYNNKQYFFTNLTFNMPTNANTDATDWTAPSGTSKWSYIYIRPSDNKFFISNNAPSAGTNYRTIGGNICLYLFTAWTSATAMFNFQINNNEYVVMGQNTLSSYNSSIIGFQLRVNYGLNGTNVATDLTTLVPSTATVITTKFRTTCNPRADSAVMSRRSESMEVQNSSGAWIQVHSKVSSKYIVTPTSTGDYFYNDNGEIAEIKLSKNTYNFANCRYNYSHNNGYDDGNSGSYWWMTDFIDGNIF